MVSHLPIWSLATAGSKRPPKHAEQGELKGAREQHTVALLVTQTYLGSPNNPSAPWLLKVSQPRSAGSPAGWRDPLPHARRTRQLPHQRSHATGGVRPT